MISARQEYLILTLLNAARTVESGFLCEKLSISERTLREDLKEINLFLGTYEINVSQTDNGKYYIEETKKTHLTKIMKDYETVCEWLPETPSQRHFIILFFLLWRDKTITMDEISEEIFVSKSCVFHDVRHLNEFVKNVTGEELSIHRAKGISFQGSETAKRKLVSALIYKHYRTDANYLMRIFMLFGLGEDEQYRKLVYLYQKSFSERNVVLTDYGFTTFLLETLAFAGRIRDGLTIKLDEKIIHGTIECTLPFDEIGKLLGITYSEEEKQWMKFIFSQKRMLENGEEFTKDEWKESEITKDFVDAVKEKYEYDFTNAPEQLKDLEKHIRSMLSRIRLDYHEDSYLAKKISKEVAKEYEIAGEIVPIIKTYTGISITDVERAYIALHLAVIMEHMKRVQNVLLISNSPAVMIQRLKSQISKVFLGQINITGCYSTHQVGYALASRNDIDFIIATHTVKKEIDLPVISINELVTQEDFERITTYIKNV